MATKLKIFTIWVLLKKQQNKTKKLHWSLSQLPSNSLFPTPSSLSTLALPPQGLTVPSSAPFSHVARSSPEKPSQTSLSKSTLLLFLCHSCLAFSHGHLSPCSLFAYLLSVSSVIEHTPQEPGCCFFHCTFPSP